MAIINSRNFDGADGRLPVALSPNEKHFAYCKSSPRFALEIRELDSLEIVARVELPQEPTTVAWSPDGRMLLLASEGGGRRLQVFDMRNSRLIPLPQPVDEHVPEGSVDWWNDEEVLFTSGASVRMLMLDTLRLRPPSNSILWNALTAEGQEKIRRGAGAEHLPVNSRWRMSPHSTIRRYTVPVNTAAEWSFDESLQLGFAQSKKAYVRTLPAADVNIGDVIIATTDGTKFVRIREHQATVFYLGLRNEPRTHFKMAMPGPPEPTLADSLAKKGVCAFVCAPMINPLNDVTVGPDREHVKALARVSAWNDKEAEFWIEEDYLTVLPGDVVADLHTWEQRRPLPAGELGKNEWFGVIDKLDESSPPSRGDAPALERQGHLYPQPHQANRQLEIRAEARE